MLNHAGMHDEVNAWGALSTIRHQPDFIKSGKRGWKDIVEHFAIARALSLV